MKEGLLAASFYLHCGGVRVAKRNHDMSLTFWYYRKGERNIINEPYQCLKFGYKNLCIEKDNCTHEWISVLNNIENKQKAKENYIDMMSNPFVKGMLGEEGIIHTAYGYEDYWCWKCGLWARQSGRP
jgi:hypothetical protein